jgi:membrane-associated phospholipid phosphatase
VAAGGGGWPAIGRRQKSPVIRSLLTALTVVFVCAGTGVNAQSALSDATSALQNDSGDQGSSGRIRLATDSGLAALAIWFETTANPLRCKWCDRDEAGRDTLNGLDRTIRDAWLWAPPHRAGAATLSTILEYSLIGGGILVSARAQPGGTVASVQPLAGSSATDRWNGVSAVVEALAGSAVLTGTFKRVAARERPWAHFQDPGSGDPNDSFVSGHTSQSFAVATAIGTLCRARHCRHQTTTWVVGLVTAGATGYLRIAADKHYMTDVLAGAGVGVLSGLAFPALGHELWNARSSSTAVSPVIMPAGVALRSMWTW